MKQTLTPTHGGLWIKPIYQNKYAATLNEIRQAYLYRGGPLTEARPLVRISVAAGSGCSREPDVGQEILFLF